MNRWSSGPIRPMPSLPDSSGTRRFLDGLWAVLVTLLSVAACSSSSSQVAPLVVDGDAPSDLSGLANGIATIEATVVATDGLHIEEYLDGIPDDAALDDLPRLIVDDIVLIRDGERGAEFVDEMQALRTKIVSGSPMRLLYTDGAYEIGRRYVIVLGGWGEGFSAMFGYDLAAGRPVEGFDTPRSRQVLAGLMEGAGSAEASTIIGDIVAEINRTGSVAVDGSVLSDDE